MKLELLKNVFPLPTGISYVPKILTMYFWSLLETVYSGYWLYLFRGVLKVAEKLRSEFVRLRARVSEPR